jgi:hypothetical protein
MRPLKSATLAGVLALAFAGSVAPSYAAQPPAVEVSSHCYVPDAGSAGARGQYGADHRDIGAAEQRAIERRTDSILAREGKQADTAGAVIPVYFHVMLDSKGNGDVTRQQINAQIDVLNRTFAGQESGPAPDSGFRFRLADDNPVRRYHDNAWHKDNKSEEYRAATRQGGADTLNIWLVDFKLLGIATFPWDYVTAPEIDGVRVHYGSLPGGPITNFNLGKTASHEVGHWLGLYHTFQGGCTELNDQVTDTPAQAGPTSGCPEGRDSCELPGLDPIHNYMDYSFDSCYDRFTEGQVVRMNEMWAAHRA